MINPKAGRSRSEVDLFPAPTAEYRGVNCKWQNLAGPRKASWVISHSQPDDEYIQYEDSECSLEVYNLS